MPPRKQSRFLNGIPELVILRLLSDREMYGYELVASIRESTDHVIDFGEGVVYPMLHSLEDDGLLATRRVEVSGRPRVYYRLTRKGKRRLSQSAADWSRINEAVGRLLGGSGEPSLS